MDERRYVYDCDPSKNKECGKQSCYINGGPCSLTYNKEYAVEETEQNESKVD